jgi:hypothetical protein
VLEIQRALHSRLSKRTVILPDDNAQH